MGQQQLLLIVLSVIIVGIVVVVGINMFAASANLEAVTNDLLNLASRAQQWYVKPSGMCGGGNSFAGMSIYDLTPKPANDNGTYSISTTGTKTSVGITGVGVQDGDRDGTNCTVMVTVKSNSIATSVVNR
jgi:hypothetical protein